MKIKKQLLILSLLVFFPLQKTSAQQNSQYTECGAGYIKSLAIQYRANNGRLVLITDLDTTGFVQPPNTTNTRLVLDRRGDDGQGNSDRTWESMRETLTMAMATRTPVRLASQTSDCRTTMDRALVRFCTTEALCSSSFVEP